MGYTVVDADAVTLKLAQGQQYFNWILVDDKFHFMM